MAVCVCVCVLKCMDGIVGVCECVSAYVEVCVCVRVIVMTQQIQACYSNRALHHSEALSWSH